jgi:hypothetical protein
VNDTTSQAFFDLIRGWRQEVADLDTLTERVTQASEWLYAHHSELSDSEFDQVANEWGWMVVAALTEQRRWATDSDIRD